MLRCHDLPSDFHPLLLIVCERPDISALMTVLSHFAEKGGPVALNRLSSVAYSACPVMISPCADNEKMGVIRGAHGLVWRIDKPTALAFACELEALLAQGGRSGSCFLEIGYIDEIRVKVTFGEFDDGWLLGEQRV